LVPRRASSESMRKKWIVGWILMSHCYSLKTQFITQTRHQHLMHNVGKKKIKSMGAQNNFMSLESFNKKAMMGAVDSEKANF
jgi:hypothetical protein